MFSFSVTQHKHSWTTCGKYSRDSVNMALSSSLENASSSRKKLSFWAAFGDPRGGWDGWSIYWSGSRLAKTLNTKAVESFLGFANYHWNFILHFSKVAAPLNATTSMAALRWDSEQELAFLDLISRLTSPPPPQYWQFRPRRGTSIWPWILTPKTSPYPKSPKARTQRELFSNPALQFRTPQGESDRNCVRERWTNLEKLLRES